MDSPNFWLHFSAGGIAASVGSAILCPLEVVKTRLQSSLYMSDRHFVQSKNPLAVASSHVRDVGRILIDISKKEGISALWKGLGPNLVGVAPARAIYFSVYSQGKHVFATLNNDQETSLVHMISAATAGFCTALATNPIWLVKTRMQLQSESLENVTKYRNSFHCAYSVLRTEGIRGLYKGLSASILGLSESTFQFVMYEYFKKVMKEHRGQESSPSWADTFGAAAVAKLIAALVTYPHEVLRTRLRQSPESNGTHKYTSLVQASKLIYREEGMRAFYGGLTPHLLRVVPNAAIMFFCYEFIVHLFQ